MRLVDLKIEDVAFGGKGVAREQGKAVFVPYTIEGELVSAEIVREKEAVRRGRAGRSQGRVRRTASRHSARISVGAVAARISTSITNISLRLNGDRCATRSRESAN